MVLKCSPWGWALVARVPPVVPLALALRGHGVPLAPLAVALVVVRGGALRRAGVARAAFYDCFHGRFAGPADK